MGCYEDSFLLSSLGGTHFETLPELERGGDILPPSLQTTDEVWLVVNLQLCFCTTPPACTPASPAGGSPPSLVLLLLAGDSLSSCATAQALTL